MSYEATSGKEPAGDPPTDHAKHTPPPVGEIHNHFTHMTEQKPLTKQEFIQQWFLARANTDLDMRFLSPAKMAETATAAWDAIEKACK
jgi:hypothetical protein